MKADVATVTYHVLMAMCAHSRESAKIPGWLVTMKDAHVAIWWFATASPPELDLPHTNDNW